MYTKMSNLFFPKKIPNLGLGELIPKTLIAGSRNYSLVWNYGPKT